ncbi:MAG TPA: CBS domain-containing protein [Arsenophonus sp.]
MALPIQPNTFKPRYHVDQANATAASYMTQNYMTLPEHISVTEAKKVFLEKLEKNNITNQIFITTNNKLMGILAVKSLLKHPTDSDSINKLMHPKFFFFAPGDKRTKLAKSLHDCGFDLVPVLDKGVLVGALSEREIDHILEDDATEDAQLQGGSLPLDKSYLQMSPFELWKKRSVWLLLQFITEAYTSTVIKSSEDQLETVIALAFLFYYWWQRWYTDYINYRLFNGYW